MNELSDSLFLNFIAAFFYTSGFCILFTVPKKRIWAASLTGALGWIAYKVLVMNGDSKILACFIGSCVVAVISEIFSRAGKEATTLFIIPGILPLVPGSGMYYTMLSAMKRDFDTAATAGYETLFMAGSIALALLIIASLTRILVAGRAKILEYLSRKSTTGNQQGNQPDR